MSIHFERHGQQVHTLGGVITQKNADLCTVRIRIPAGDITVERMAGLVAVAKKFGNGSLHLTNRQSIEIPHVDPHDLEEMACLLEENGTPVGAEFTEVVNVVACPGTDRCKLANIDSITLAKEIDKRYFRMELPLRMRIAVSSCPNSCVSSWVSDIGIIGVQKPIRNPTLCSGCGTCVDYCKEKALYVKRGAVILDEGKCTTCGNCIHTCQFNVITGKPLGYQIMVGGSHGRFPHLARYLATVSTEESALLVVEGILDWVRRFASEDKRFRTQIEEEGYDAFRRYVLENVQKDTIETVENTSYLSQLASTDTNSSLK
ncbi:4Fe-4S binding protein [uncultured Methanocorpusculum sp.]|nr:4Fe-4S binding protein [uncultured Methanocorpusculum sp.]